MFEWLNRIRHSVPVLSKGIQENKPDLRCRLGYHDFFDPTSEQPLDAWFMDDIQRFHVQYPIQNGHLYCKRCGKKKVRKVGVFFDTLPFMIQL